MTRVSAGARKCPNCGRDLAPAAAGDDTEAPRRLAPPRAPRADTKRKSAASEPAAAAPAQPAPAQPRTTPPAALPALILDADAVRAVVTANPELIEPGLRVYRDEGVPVGAGFPTDVGEIDLLALDDAGGLVVAMVAEGDPDKAAVLELLERIGFVRTHVAQPGQEVRGLLLTERLPEPVRYAIAAVGGTLTVKGWRVALRFDDLPL
jgi:hypothetical protein